MSDQFYYETLASILSSYPVFENPVLSIPRRLYPPNTIITRSSK